VESGFLNWHRARLAEVFAAFVLSWRWLRWCRA